jgi:hypothetical protein
MEATDMERETYDIVEMDEMKGDHVHVVVPMNYTLCSQGADGELWGL